MADCDGFKCPKCKTEFTIGELELHDVYSEDGAQTDFECTTCYTELIIYSSVNSWSFKAEEPEE